VHTNFLIAQPPPLVYILTNTPFLLGGIIGHPQARFINASYDTNQHLGIQPSHPITPIPTVLSFPPSVAATANAPVNPISNIQIATPIMARPPYGHVPPSPVVLDPLITFPPNEGWQATSYSAAPQQQLPPPFAALQPSQSCFGPPQVLEMMSTAGGSERFQQPTCSLMSRDPFFMSAHGAEQINPATFAEYLFPCLVVSDESGIQKPVDIYSTFRPLLLAPLAHVNPLLDHPPNRSVGVADQFDLLRVPHLFLGTNGTERRSPLSESGSSGSPFSPLSTPSTIGGHHEASPAHLGMVRPNIIPGVSDSDITLAGGGLPLFPTPHPHSQYTNSAVSGTVNTTLHPSPSQAREVVGPPVATAPKRKFKHQRLKANIEEMRRRLPRGGALDKLTGRILSTDWYHNDVGEPAYSQALGLTAGLEGLKLKDGQSIFLAFQDGKNRCALCYHQANKPNRMVRHMRMHFGLRPHECQLPGCVSCKDRWVWPFCLDCPIAD
jgi:hypothetical protein